MSTPRPASRKIYVSGSRQDLRVPMREVLLSAGEPSFTLYDTSGPYTDPETFIDIKAGLPPLRRPWILERGDTINDAVVKLIRERSDELLLDRQM